MTDETKHTPTPESILGMAVYLNDDRTELMLLDESMDLVASLENPLDKDRARFDKIVRACNAHGDLVEALTRLIGSYGTAGSNGADFDFAKNTLAKAKAGAA